MAGKKHMKRKAAPTNMVEAVTGNKPGVDVETGYKLAVKVLLPLNHDRYKSYFTQFIVLHFGLFSAMNMDFLSKNPAKVLILSAVGIFFSRIWWLTLKKIYADITALWGLIQDYEEARYGHEKYKDILPALIIKTHKSCDKDLTGSGKLMMRIPILIGLVYVIIFVWSIVTIIQKMVCPCSPCGITQ